MLDRNSFLSELFQREYPTLIQKAYRLTGSRYLAEDLIQEAFLLALVHCNELICHPSPGGWISITIFNLARNERRRIESHPEISLEEAIDLPTCGSSCSLDELLPLQLSESDRQLLIWRFEQQLDYREIASRLGIAEGACRARVFRILKKCKDILKNQY